MKKTALLLLVCMLAVSFAACRAEAPSETEDKIGLAAEGAHFSAKVIDIGENSLLLEITNGETSGISEGSEVWVSAREETAVDYGSYAKGDTVRVYFDGTAMESYPLQINSATEIGFIAVTTE